MEKQQVVVMGRNYTSILGMVRAVAEPDYDITIIKSVRKIPSNKIINKTIGRLLGKEPIDSKSKYISKYMYTIEPNREELIKLLLGEFSNTNKKVILLPTDDYTASTIDLFQEKLKEKFLYPNILNQTGKIVEYMDKDYQKEKAKDSNLNVAIGKIIDFKDNEYILPSDIKYPIFTKPQISFKGNKNLIKRCNNEEELKEIIDTASKNNNCPILIEEFIKIEKEYGVLGCSFNGEVYMPAIIEKIRCGSGSHNGVTLLGYVGILDDKYGELKTNLEKFIKNINFSGLFDIDLYESNGKIYFNELNLRFGAGGYGVTKSGVNLPKIFVKKLLNEPIEYNGMIEEKTFISEKVALEEFTGGYITWKEYKKLYENIDINFIKSNEDKQPYKIFKRKARYDYLKNSIKKRKSK